MQGGDSHNQKRSLFSAMNRFMGAVTNMDQTVMVPSVLRGVPLVTNMDQTVMVPGVLQGVPLEHGVNGDVKLLGTTSSTPPNAPVGASNGDVGGGGGAYFPDGDMYSSYVLLKSIRNDMEWGLVRDCREDLSKTTVPPPLMADADWDEEEGEEEEEDLQKQFHFHLSGLHAVLNKLTRKADSLTTRYKQEIGVRGCGN